MKIYRPERLAGERSGRDQISRRLDLYDAAGFVTVAFRNDEETLLRRRGIIDQLPDRSRRVDDCRARRIGREVGQRLQRSTAVTVAGKGKR